MSFDGSKTYANIHNAALYYSIVQDAMYDASFGMIFSK